MRRRNLLLIHRGQEYQRDFMEIARKVWALDNSIRIFLVPATMKVDLPEAEWQFPTLTVSVCSSYKAVVKRGTVLTNRFIDKISQADIARAHGIRTPPTAKFTPGMKLDPIVFGDFVIIKPMSLTSSGQGVQLFRRQFLEKLSLSSFPRSHLIHWDRKGYLVQKFIDTGEYPSWNRVMTFFGRPIYAVSGTLTTKRPDLQAPDLELAKATIAIQGATRQRIWKVDSDVLDLARRVGQAFPDIPLLAIDIIRDFKRGDLYFLECNPGGNTWHFSSTQPGGVTMRHQLGEIDKNGPEKALELGRQRMIDQFRAFDVIAEALVEKTVSSAS